MRGAISRWCESVCEKNSFCSSPSRLVRAIRVISFGSISFGAVSLDPAELPAALVTNGWVFAESTSTGSFELERSKMRKLTSSNVGLGGSVSDLDLLEDLLVDDLRFAAMASFAAALARAWS